MFRKTSVLLALLIYCGLSQFGWSASESFAEEPDCYATISLNCADVLSGHNAKVMVSVKDLGTFGRLDLLLTIDATRIQFFYAEPLGALTYWEYFTFRYSEENSCEGACPKGIVRLIGIADMPNGIAPDPAAFQPEGDIIRLTFRATEDLSFICDCFNVRWMWSDCDDNVFTSVHRDTLLMAENIEQLLPGDQCLKEDDSGVRIPHTRFIDGCICIRPPPTDRGHGDCNGDWRIDGADVVYWIDFVFNGGPAPISDIFCDSICRANFNCDDRVNLVDIAAMIRYVYRPPAPGPCNTCAD